MPILPSFPVQNFVPTAYVGQFYVAPVWLLSKSSTTQATANGGVQVIQQGQASLTINTIFDWLNTYPSQAASVIIQSNGSAGQPSMNKIEMVYVNNVNNVNDVTVYFPDSGMLVTAPAGTAGYYPVFTYGLVCTVYNGYTAEALVASEQHQTQIIFCNFAVAGFATQAQPVTTNSLALPWDMTNTDLGNELLPPGNYSISECEITPINGTAQAAGICQGSIQLLASSRTEGAFIGSTASTIASAAGAVIFNNGVARMTWANPLRLPPGNAVNYAPIGPPNDWANLSLMRWQINISFNEYAGGF